MSVMSIMNFSSKFFAVSLIFFISIGHASTDQQSDIQKRPTLHEKLPDALLERIRVVSDGFKELTRVDYETQVEEYKKIRRPELLVEASEYALAAYNDYCRINNCEGFLVKSVVYELLMARSFMPTEKALASVDRRGVLTKSEAMDILNRYPSPIINPHDIY